MRLCGVFLILWPLQLLAQGIAPFQTSPTSNDLSFDLGFPWSQDDSDIEILISCVEVCGEVPQFCICLMSCVMLATTLLCCVFHCSICINKHKSQGQTSLRREANRVNDKNPVLVSGKYRGWYQQNGKYQWLPDFDLYLNCNMSITGEGTDNIGHYTLSGSWCKGCLTIAKRYQLSPNFAGIWSPFNKGHRVVYVGHAAGNTLAHGLKGEWRLKYNGHLQKGTFHLWPMELPSVIVAQWNELGKTPIHATSDNICAVCFENGINTMARHCRHAIVCSSCAMRLTQCPICRKATDFGHYEGYN